ncbi:hypothetical protein [Corynebacterium lubricantis]|uniref:hypothetical protein n=1 Tax=Corynebacterium lubricantis TaxID=541095 RepID=UPI000374ADC4|nr:hypothetical protein [Corynebacterium lubricantis]
MINAYSYSTSQNRTSASAASTASTASAARRSPITHKHAELLSEISSILHHPRSLARPISSWRPPTKTLPGVFGGGPLTMAISRHRVGPRVQARLQGYGETRTPAYLITIRITDPAGFPAPRSTAEEWIRALLPENIEGAVHELSSHTAVTYVWIVDSKFQPLQSPASMFQASAAA